MTVQIMVVILAFHWHCRISVGSSNTNVLSTCLLCSCPFDDYSSRCRCASCRMLVLVCDSCRVCSVIPRISATVISTYEFLIKLLLIFLLIFILNYVLSTFSLVNLRLHAAILLLYEPAKLLYSRWKVPFTRVSFAKNMVNVVFQLQQLKIASRKCCQKRLN